MRALKASGAARVLRIGVVQAGRVVEERVLAEHGDVTVGGDEACTVVVGGLPSSVRVLHHTRAGYTFTVGAGMKGRVALESGLTDLAPGQSVTLGETARGKLVMGATTLLFQFVEPPPPRQKPQLPLSVRGGLEARIDWPLTVLVAMSFLLHFGFVGSMYSDWMDPPVAEGSV
ncbi:MAG: energy transducer TonB, partial [Polyangiaceae bacterium]|nr:energy transducer TonB [Polyangiaceae bacterium]